VTPPSDWTAPAPNRALLAASGVRVSYRDVYGTTETRAAIINHLKEYTLAEVLDYLGRLSAVVHKAGPSDIKVQKQLCAQLFGDEAQRVWNAVVRAAQDRESRPVVIFDEVPIGLATKFALFVLPVEPAPPTNAPMHHLGQALLMINGLLDQAGTAPRGISLDSEEGWNAWVYYQYFLGVAVANDNARHLLARTYDLFLTDHPGTQVGNRSMTAWAVKATGIEPDRLWAILFAFLTHFYSIDASGVHKTTAWISRRSFFDDFGFSHAETDAFFRLVSSPVEEVAADVALHFSLNDLRPYDLLPIARSPLVVVGDFAICPYMRLLLERMTMGLYHILFNAETDKTPEGSAARTQFQSFVGNVWEDYVDRLFVRVIHAMPAAAARPVYLGPKELQAAVPQTKKGERPPVADHLLVYGSVAVIIESKAKFMPMDVRFGLNRPLFVERFAHLFVSAARQLDATVTHLRAGTLDRDGIDCGLIETVIPVVASLAEYPLQPWAFDWLRHRVRDAGYLQQRGVRPLELLTASDIDRLEQPLSDGHSLASILAAKSNDGEWSKHSFHNWAIQRGPTYLRTSRSPYLDGIYKYVTERMDDILASSRKDPKA
jgi:hypothetical protein